MTANKSCAIFLTGTIAANWHRHGKKPPRNQAPQTTTFLAEALDIEEPLKTVLPMVANIKQATGQQIELHATDVNAFYDHLHQFDRIIKQTGQSLSNHVSEKAIL